jgi:hypothetical protein
LVELSCSNWGSLSCFVREQLAQLHLMQLFVARLERAPGRPLRQPGRLDHHRLARVGPTWAISQTVDEMTLGQRGTLSSAERCSDM